MKIHDENRVPEFLKMLDQLSSHHIEIGIFGDGEGGKIHKNSNITILAIATVHEFGTTIKYKSGKSTTIPERSYIRKTFDSKQTEIVKKGNKLLEGVISLKTPVNIFFDTMGEYLVGLVQETLTDLRTPPNAPSTIIYKGSSNPLIDTGRLRQSITYKVVKR